MKRTLFLTGAGLSKASGVPTYRGTDGYYTNNPKLYSELLQTRYEENKTKLWNYVLDKRALFSTAKPNQAHYLLKEIEDILKDDFLLVTQNVDGLHKDAGNVKVLELHGNIWSLRFETQDKLEYHMNILNDGYFNYLGYSRLEYLLLMGNSECSTTIKQSIANNELPEGFRPNVTFFNESISERIYAIHEFLKDEVSEVYLIGTSLEISSAINVINLIKNKYPNVKIYNVNPEKRSNFIDIVGDAISFLDMYLAKLKRV